MKFFLHLSRGVGTTPLTEERSCFVVAEHRRLMRKLKRMSAANAMLAPQRLPDVAAGETIQDVVRWRIDERVAVVMRDIDALRADDMRVQAIYFGVVSRSWDAMAGAPSSDQEC